MTDDDDILTGPVPLPEAEPTPAERAHAKTFAELSQQSPSERLRLNIGELLLRALTASQPRGSDGVEHKLVS